MPAIYVICTGCKKPTAEPNRGRCPRCYSTWQKSDGARRQAHPRAAIYANPKWKTAARACLNRDHWKCVDCGRHHTQLGDNERLGADHLIPVMDCDDPYDVGNLQARCSTCSGHKDGGRAHKTPPRSVL